MVKYNSYLLEFCILCWKWTCLVLIQSDPQSNDKKKKRKNPTELDRKPWNNTSQMISKWWSNWNPTRRSKTKYSKIKTTHKINSTLNIWIDMNFKRWQRSRIRRWHRAHAGEVDKWWRRLHYMDLNSAKKKNRIWILDNWNLENSFF